MGLEAFVTFGANDSSALGCMVLGRSLRKQGTLRSLVALVTENLSPGIRKLLAAVFDLVHCVPSISFNQLSTMNHSYLEANIALPKINCWCLTQFTKCVYLDADTLVLQNCDELFERSELSAAADTGWPDCFNSGVFVFTPSLPTYYALIDIFRHQGSYDGSDQGLLNCYFGRDWKLDLAKRLPFIYNLVSSSSYTYTPAYQQFGKNAKIIHFVGYPKPWAIPWNSVTGKIQASGVPPQQEQYLQEWLDIFTQDILPMLPKQSQKITQDKGVISDEDFQGSGIQKPVNEIKFQSSQTFAASQPRHLIVSAEVEQDRAAVASTSGWTTDLPTKLLTSATPFATQLSPSPWLLSQVERNGAKDDQVVHQHHIACDPRELEEHEVFAVCQSKSIEDKDSLPSTSESATPSSNQSLHHTQETTAELSLGFGYTSNTTDSQLLLPEDVEQHRLQNWEEGNIDYQGRDSFDNIWNRLQHFIKDTPASEHEISINKTCDLLTDVQNIPVTNCNTSAVSSSTEDEPEVGLPGYPVGDYAGMHRWEQGNIDYNDRDSSDRIMRRLDYLIHGINFVPDQS